MDVLEFPYARTGSLDEVLAKPLGVAVELRYLADLIEKGLSQDPSFNETVEAALREVSNVAQILKIYFGFQKEGRIFDSGQVDKAWKNRKVEGTGTWIPLRVKARDDTTMFFGVATRGLDRESLGDILEERQFSLNVLAGRVAQACQEIQRFLQSQTFSEAPRGKFEQKFLHFHSRRLVAFIHAVLENGEGPVGPLLRRLQDTDDQLMRELYPDIATEN